MKRIQAIEMNRDEFIQILQTLTDSGKLVDVEENWKDAINFAISIEDIMDEKEIKEKIAEYLGIDEIKYYILDGSTIILVHDAKGSYDGNMPIKYCFETIKNRKGKTMEEVKVYVDCLNADNRGDFVRCTDCGELMLMQIGGTDCGECESENLQWYDNNRPEWSIAELEDAGFIIIEK